jgi:hypothetical protein
MKLGDIFYEMSIVTQQLGMGKVDGARMKHELKMKYGYFVLHYGVMSVECVYYVGKYRYHSGENTKFNFWNIYSCSTPKKLSELSSNILSFHKTCIEFENMIENNTEFNNTKELENERF